MTAATSECHQGCGKTSGKECDRDETLFEVFYQNAMMLYDKFESQLCSKSAEIRDSKFEYLTHKVMADMNFESHNDNGRVWSRRY